MKFKIFGFFMEVNSGGGELACDPRAALPLPGGFSAAEEAGERVVSWRWSPVLGSAFGVVFAAVWNGILFVVLYFASRSKGMDAGSAAVLLLMFGMGLWFAYVSLAHLLDRTTLRVGRGRVAVEHGPLPWPGKELLLVDIERSWCERRDSGEDTFWAPAVSYAVCVKRRGVEKTEWLIWDLSTPEQALYLERQLRRE
ncbi:MAG: hypothetical protein HY078_09355 [Elusimicrobia bacterium]|nr:hypothetical protein [Elusimicrobiota bacterium]